MKLEENHLSYKFSSSSYKYSSSSSFVSKDGKNGNVAIFSNPLSSESIKKYQKGQSELDYDQDNNGQKPSKYS